MPDTPTAAARVAFMIGHPVAHTAMPKGVNAWARETGTDAMMTPADVPPEAFAGFVDMMRRLSNCDGAVVTAPHKQVAASLVDTLTPAARLVGAANVIIRRQDGSLIGDNSDGAGFVAALEVSGAGPGGQRAILFGCGGAGASIGAALAAAGVATLDLVDSDHERAHSLARRIGGAARDVSSPGSLGDYDLVINATAVGLDGKSLVHPLTGLKQRALVADVVTKPPMTPLLLRAESAGARIQTGSEMALAQIPIILGLFGWDRRRAKP